MGKRRFTAVIVLVSGGILCSCISNYSQKNLTRNDSAIMQKENEPILLKLEKAISYRDPNDISNSTAEWKIIVSKEGRYKVWLTSATRDTVNLNYNNPVRILLLDNRLEENPGCDRIFVNSDEINYPYFRADSYMGSLYFPEPGEYIIQVISEKVVAKAVPKSVEALSDDTMLMSVILEPLHP